MQHRNEIPVSGQLRSLAEKKQIPIAVTIELTHQCNLTCTHCYNFDRTDRSKLTILKNELDSELSREEILNLIDDLEKAQTLYVTFTGGEPTLHPHLIEFIERARAYQMLVRLKSNGIIAPKVLAQLQHSQLGGVDISLYGTSAESHDTITTRKGSFENTIQTIKTLRAFEIPVHVNFVISRYALHEVPLTDAFATELNVSSALTFDITKRYDSTDGPLNLRVNYDDLVQLYSGPLQSLVPPPNFSKDRSVQCGCALASCAVSRLGEVYPCIGAPIPSGNIREQAFIDIWKNSPQLESIRNLKLQDFKECEPCPLRAHCQRSSGNVYVTTGNYTGAEEWACMDAQARQEAYQAQITPS